MFINLIMLNSCNYSKINNKVINITTYLKEYHSKVTLPPTYSCIVILSNNCGNCSLENKVFLQRILDLSSASVVIVDGESIDNNLPCTQTLKAHKALFRFIRPSIHNMFYLIQADSVIYENEITNTTILQIEKQLIELKTN